MSHLPARLRWIAVVAVTAALFAAPSIASAAPLKITAMCDLPGVGPQPVALEVDIPDTLPQRLVSPYRVTSVRSDALEGLDTALSPSVRFFMNYFWAVSGSGATQSDVTFAYPLTGPVEGKPVLPVYPGPGLLRDAVVEVLLTSRDDDGAITVDRRECVSSDPVPRFIIPTVYAIPQPTGLTATRVLPTAVQLTWTQDGPADVSFEVFWDDGEFDADVVSSATTEKLVTGLRPGATYHFEVIATSAHGDAWSEPLRVTTPAEPLGRQSFQLSGVTAVPKLFQGNATVTGALDFSLNADGSLADTSLTLDPVTVPLVIERNLPITAKLVFLTAAKPTGTLKAGVLKFAAAIRVKVTDARLFGTVPIATGSNCQARNLTRFSFTSPVGFTRDLGGTMVSGYEFGDLVGCTGLNGLLSRETTSRFNTIKVEATPAQR